MQASLDNGCFTRQISFAKVNSSVTISNVVAGISKKNCGTTTGLAFGAHGGGFGGTPFGGYLRVRAGSGKLEGTGGTLLTSLRVVLFSDGDGQRRR